MINDRAHSNEDNDPHVRPIQNVVNQMRARYGLVDASIIDGLRSQWPELVGENVSRVSRVLDIRAGVISVEVDDPSVAESVRWSAKRIMLAVSEIDASIEVDHVHVKRAT